MFTGMRRDPTIHLMSGGGEGEVGLLRGSLINGEGGGVN